MTVQQAKRRERALVPAHAQTYASLAAPTVGAARAAPRALRPVGGMRGLGSEPARWTGSVHLHTLTSRWRILGHLLTSKRWRIPCPPTSINAVTATRCLTESSL